MIEGSPRLTQMWVLRVELERGAASPLSPLGGTTTIVLGSDKEPGLALAGTLPLPDTDAALNRAIETLEKELDRVVGGLFLSGSAAVRSPESDLLGGISELDAAQILALEDQVTF